MKIKFLALLGLLCLPSLAWAGNAAEKDSIVNDSISVLKRKNLSQEDELNALQALMIIHGGDFASEPLCGDENISKLNKLYYRQKTSDMLGQGTAILAHYFGSNYADCASQFPAALPEKRVRDAFVVAHSATIYMLYQKKSDAMTESKTNFGYLPKLAKAILRDVIKSNLSDESTKKDATDDLRDLNKIH